VKKKASLIFLRRCVLILFIPFITAIVLRIFFIEIYKIPSSSMSPTLINGDFILVSKISYGPRLLKLKLFYNTGIIETKRMIGLSQIKKDDIIVFNQPNFNDKSSPTKNISESVMVKRCFAISGGTVIINEGVNKIIKTKYSLFPHDSLLGWTLNNYGPLHVPAAGEKMELTERSISWYGDIINYENPSCRIADSIILGVGKTVRKYTFKHDYYFMIGDNFYYSQDSRYWGFVPQDNIIGKVVLIIFSIDQNQVGPERIRWNRLFKAI
jgi:signal peptidase I